MKIVGLDNKIDNCFYELYSCFSYFLMGAIILSHIGSAFSIPYSTSFQDAQGMSGQASFGDAYPDKSVGSMSFRIASAAVLAVMASWSTRRLFSPLIQASKTDGVHNNTAARVGNF